MANQDPYDNIKSDLHAAHWDFGHTKVHYQTETNERFMSENRNKLVQEAIRARKEPESMQLGKLLKKSHINLSVQPDKEKPRSEGKSRFIPQKIEIAESYAATNGAELRKSNIDLAVGVSKSGKDWTSVLKSTMSANEDVKFACAKPQGFDELGAELRKSNVLLHAGRHDFRQQALPVHRPETERQYGPKPLSPTVGFSQTLGKELRTSSIGVAFGSLSKPNKTQYESQQKAIMGDHNDEKWACKKPEGFYHLIAELRKTNVSLGTDKVVYGSEGTTRPVRDDRRRRAAGAVPGL